MGWGEAYCEKANAIGRRGNAEGTEVAGVEIEPRCGWG